MSGIVTSVCVVHALREGYYHQTAIDKRPVSGAVDVTELGIAGDRQVDRSHGGRDAAVYVYADEDAAYWENELVGPCPPGYFGGNLRTSGLDVNGARIGERWRIGDLLLEVRQPRTPCDNLALRLGSSTNSTSPSTGPAGSAPSAGCCRRALLRPATRSSSSTDRRTT